MNWRVATLDKLIARAIERGFDDPDFVGWTELDGQVRVNAVNQVLHHNGVGQIVFRKRFADAAFVGPKPLYNEDQLANYPDVTRNIKTLGDYYRVQIMLSDDWLLYIRMHRDAWDIDKLREVEL